MSAVRPITVLLSQLKNVRAVSQTSWRGDCPNGHLRTKGSLSITETGDGTLLLHCFACSDIEGILSHLGLTITDLFPRPSGAERLDARCRARDEFRRYGWQAALRVLSREAAVVSAAAGLLSGGSALAIEDEGRLMLAIQRIDDAREVLA